MNDASHDIPIVYIVDDVRLNVELMKAILQRHMDVVTEGFVDPQDALKRCAERIPSIILLDYEMPVMRGTDFIRALRTVDGGDLVPVIIVTAHDDRASLMDSLNAGANDFVRKPIDELELVARVRNSARLSIISQRMAWLATTDELTRIGNRRFFLDRLDAEIGRATRYGSQLSLAIMDIDHFKRVNDTDGHAAGDDVLREFAGRLSAQVRTVDVVGRLGGEEFGWILPMAASTEAAGAVERMRHKVATQPFAGGRPVTASFGLATYQPGQTAAALIAAADARLYEAKAAGRNRVSFDGGMSG